MTLDVKSLYL